MFELIKNLFSGSSSDKSGGGMGEKMLDIIDAATDSPEERVRKFHAQMLNSKGADTRRLLVLILVPFTLILISAILICEATGNELPPNFYSIMTWLCGIVAVIVAFYFEYGRQNTKNQFKAPQLSAPISHSKKDMTERFSRNREEDQNYENPFELPKRN